MRRRQLKRLWARLKQLSTMRLTREELLMKLGAARDQSRSAWRLVTIEVAAEDATLSYRLDRNKLRQTRWHEGQCAVEKYAISFSLRARSDAADAERRDELLSRVKRGEGEGEPACPYATTRPWAAGVRAKRRGI
jgi:hypothetical protein